MDKHEFNIKVDQIKKMVSKGDFETAMKIADTIDWRRVRNANLLSMISSVYEKNAEYQEAKDILLIAFERAPIGKRLLYKLTQLALKEGEIEEAESYYREFCDLAGDDPRQDILRYLILKAKGAPIEQLIHSLETYTSTELDEKWLYELAELYHQAGKADECVRICDKIMLMYGLGQYVDKAMELKLQYAPLTKYQMDLVENRDKYEEKLRQVEQNGASAVVLNEDTISREEEEMAAAARRGQVAAMEARNSIPANASPNISNDPPTPTQGYPGNAAYPGNISYSGNAAVYSESMPQKSVVEYPEAAYSPAPVNSPAVSSVNSGYHGQVKEEEVVSNIAASFAAATADTQDSAVSPEERLEVSMKEAEAEASLAEEMSKISMDGYSEEPVREKTRVLKNVKDLKKNGEQAEKTKVLDEIRHIQTVKTPEEQGQPESVQGQKAQVQYFSHLMVEARDAEEGLKIAVESLKKAHQILAYKHPAAKISGEKLSQKGILASAPKLAGKDLIVENAGDLSDAMLEELDKLLDGDKGQMQVILVDTPRQMEGIRRISPSLAAKFHVITSVEEAEKIFSQKARINPVRREALPQKQAASRLSSQKEAAFVQSDVLPREEVTRQPVSLREKNTASQPAPQKEHAATRQPAVHLSAVQRGQEVTSQTASRSEQIAAHQMASQKETASARQDGLRTDASAISSVSSVSGDTRVFSRVETAASSNIVQMRNKPVSVQEEYEPKEQDKANMDEPDDGRIMDIDEFAQYCCHYASQIDCNISGKSMLALYERIEIMDEDGVALTKTAAEDLIEEAADRAEKPSLGKRIAGLFSSKYDKEGLLILKEEHFI